MYNLAGLGGNNMTKEELEKATGQELIEQRDYCGVDGYYGDYLDNVNAEMLKRFNRLADLENKIADIKANCDLAIEGRDIKIKELEQELTVEKDQHQEEINLHLHAEEYIESLEKENAELKHNKKTVAHLADCLEEKMKERIEELERLNSNQAESLRVTMLEEEKKGKRIAELEKQIEKMKCCFNCKHSRTEYEHCRTDKYEKWEIKENEL